MATDIDRRDRFQAVADVVYEPLQRYFGRRARPGDVSDLLNDVLLVIWRRLDDVPTDDPLPWSYAVASRCLANHRRGELRRLRLVDRLIAQPRNRDVASEPMMFQDGPVALASALDELGESDRELIRLWAWEQLEPRQIATVMGTTANAVSLRLTRAKKRLAASMQRQDGARAGQEEFGHRREPRT